MPTKIHVAVLDDHQSIIDGYIARLNHTADIEVIATAYYGEDLEPLLAHDPVDVLILDVSIPISQENRNPYPVLYTIPRLLESYPDLAILVVSMFNNRTLIQAVIEAGANGYIAKDDQADIRDLPAIIRIVASGGIHLSKSAYEQYAKNSEQGPNAPLTTRQLEALSLCAVYPEANTYELATKMKIAHSTLRNLLSQAYLKLSAHSRAAAVLRAQQLGLLAPKTIDPDMDSLTDEPDKKED
jgi:DNA-binding NarL/FixJ family response regulator